MAATPAQRMHIVLALLLCVVVRTNASSASPLSIPPSLYWDGDDGQWSTFQVEVGTPGQTVRLLPCTSANPGSTMWVIIEPGCSGVNPSLAGCPNSRGNVFQSNLSSTWSTQGLQSGIDGAIYSLDTYEETFLGLDGNGSYGYDTVSLGLPGSGLPTLEHLVVAGIWSNSYFLGSLGLSPVPFNFTSVNNPQISMLGSLVNQSLVPSASWAYTAGAYYEGVFGSLTLGGYDKTRFEPSNVTFNFGADFSRDLVVSLQSITYSTVGSSPLLAQSIDIFIDSLVSEIWLPVDVCQAFAQQFNLTWIEQDQYYIVDEIAHRALLAENPEFSFKIGHAGQESNEVVSIVLPYAAFDLNLTAPIAETPTRYFPLKQAQNSTQYTLGRVLLQEAYVIADYDRKVFSVSQALFPDTSVEQDIVAIGSGSGIGIGHGSGGGSSHLSIAAVSGIIAGSISVFAASCLLLYCCVKRRQRRAGKPMESIEVKKELPEPLVSTIGSEMEGDGAEVKELDSGAPMVLELHSQDGPWSRHELEHRETVYEIAGRELHVYR